MRFPSPITTVNIRLSSLSPAKPLQWWLRPTDHLNLHTPTNAHNFSGEKNWQILIRSTFNHVMFLQKYKENQFFCGCETLMDGVFVTQLCSIVEISVYWIVWVMTNCCFMSDTWTFLHLSVTNRHPQRDTAGNE